MPAASDDTNHAHDDVPIRISAIAKSFCMRRLMCPNTAMGVFSFDEADLTVSQKILVDSGPRYGV
jgi:hypothetical protein